MTVTVIVIAVIAAVVVVGMAVVVAAMAALRTIGNGYQAAIMAPTELLAEQHLRSFRDWLEPLGIEPVWLSGKVTGKSRRAALDAIEQDAPLIIGTHALMQEGVNFGKFIWPLV